MEIIFKGLPEDIEKFMNEIVYPVIRKRQAETMGHYFRITEDKKDYWSRKPESGTKIRRFKGYFPELYAKYKDPAYYKVDYAAESQKILLEDNNGIDYLKEVPEPVEAEKRALEDAEWYQGKVLEAQEENKILRQRIEYLKNKLKEAEREQEENKRLKREQAYLIKLLELKHKV